MVNAHCLSEHVFYYILVTVITTGKTKRYKQLKKEMLHYIILNKHYIIIIISRLLSI